jgi:lambda repressor-like predicted transcriptional regulator
MKASPKVKQIIRNKKSEFDSTTDVMRTLSNEAGMSLSSFYRLLREPSKSGYNKLQRVAQILGCTVEDILATA